MEKNKILILMMSCDTELYNQEEEACRETFLKDAEKMGVPYYFYKGINEEHKEKLIDSETHTMYLPVSDGLGSTSRKTVIAFDEALKIDGWDYIVKTNLSTWLDVKKIVEAVEGWEGKVDRNIYGARFLANEASKNVPFPRGHFVILSRSLVEAVVKWSPKLILSEGMPKTDDTLICLALLYEIQKVLGDSYIDRLKEVPAVNEWSDEIQDSAEFVNALSIRCKDEKEPNQTPEHLKTVHKLKHGRKTNIRHFRPAKLIETKYGYMTYERYQKVLAIEKKVKEAKENPHQ